MPRASRRARLITSSISLHQAVESSYNEGDSTGRDTDDYGRPWMVSRATNREEQVATSGYVERLAVRSNGQRERLMRNRNGYPRRISGDPDRCHGVITRVEDVERPSVRRDGHIEGLVAHWDCG